MSPHLAFQMGPAAGPAATIPKTARAPAASSSHPGAKLAVIPRGQREAGAYLGMTGLPPRPPPHPDQVPLPTSHRHQLAERHSFRHTSPRGTPARGAGHVDARPRKWPARIAGQLPGQPRTARRPLAATLTPAAVAGRRANLSHQIPPLVCHAPGSGTSRSPPEPGYRRGFCERCRGSAWPWC